MSIIISFIVILILTSAMIVINIKIVNKKIRIISAIIYSVLVAILFFSYGGTIFDLNDSIFDSIYKNIYFPSIGTYVITIIISLLFVILTSFSKKIKTVIKLINVSAFFVLLFLFILVLNGLISNEINISNQLRIYENESLATLIQTSMIIFIIWILSIGANTLLNFLSKKYGKQKEEYIEFL